MDSMVNVLNWIQGQECASKSGNTFDKLNPATGNPLAKVSKSNVSDVTHAVAAAKSAFSTWSQTTPLERGEILRKWAIEMREHQSQLATIVAEETGKSKRAALGETQGAIALAEFFAGEGQRLYGRTTTSGTKDRMAMTIRQPVGVAALIIPANTPIANVAWKTFPALICGNSAILKASEDAPSTASFMARLSRNAGLPAGVFNVLHGFGEECGAPLVAHPDVGVVSFTGSTSVGKTIQRIAGERLAKVSLELGGKNPLVVCDDADVENALHWSIQSAFSNAGQRCAAASRILIYDSVYETFRDQLVSRTKKLKVGPSDSDDFGPVINARQLNNMLSEVTDAINQGARLLTGGARCRDPELQGGFYMEPTILENVSPQSHISSHELFGPITILYRVKNFEEALKLCNDSPYGLTAAIHTRNIHRAHKFCEMVEAGTTVINGGTFGSEPHMPFGGVKQSGNGTREPGTEALDIYSNVKNVYIHMDTKNL